MPVPRRTPKELPRQVLPLLLLGIVLIGTNQNFTMIDDETRIIAAAAQPVRTTLALFWSGAGQHEHPPLYDLLLHFWLKWTGGAFEYLRVFPVVFYLVGLFLLGRAARRLAGADSANAVIWIGVFWPFGFLYGRIAAWYSFSFFLVAGLTLAYLHYLETPTRARRALLIVLCAALLWTNYFGWAILGCLAIDRLLRYRAAETTAKPADLLRMAVVLCLAFLPLLRAFRTVLSENLVLHQSPLGIVATAAFNVYSFFVSESVAPWFWFLSIPAGLAALACIGLVAASVPAPARRFLLYSGICIAMMAVTGILVTKRLLLIAPWVLLPIGLAVGTGKSRIYRFGLPLALLVIAGIGWYGIYSRRYYSAPRFIEPWERTAQDAAAKVRGGATVIANNPSFFFYLTYILRVPESGASWKFAGTVPDQVQHPQVMSPEQWLASGHPFAPSMIWVRGMGGQISEGPMEQAAQELDHGCGARTSRLFMRDEGYKWKQRIFPERDELPWRIEVREYDCSATSPDQTLPIPSR
jgi:hypothetical protein